MKRRYSKVYKALGKSFRYDYENSVLQYVCKVNKQILVDNEEWNAEFGRDMWNIENGYAVIDTIGLGKDNWKEDPEYWCEQYAWELKEEIAGMI